jgi:hypothetical protein
MLAASLLIPLTELSSTVILAHCKESWILLALRRKKKLASKSSDLFCKIAPSPSAEKAAATRKRRASS